MILENRYQLRRIRYSTLREPRLIKLKFSERVVRAARPKRTPTVADVLDLESRSKQLLKLNPN